MSAANYDLVIDQGSTFTIDLVVKENSVIKNLTGYSAVSYTHLTLPTKRIV